MERQVKSGRKSTCEDRRWENVFFLSRQTETHSQQDHFNGKGREDTIGGIQGMKGAVGKLGENEMRRDVDEREKEAEMMSRETSLTSSHHFLIGV